jgi:hypothetical protein
MRPVFRGFCINRFGIGPLHYISSCSDFGFEFTIEKRLFESASRGVANSQTRRVADSPTRRVADSPTRRVGESAIEYLKENSPLRWVGESSTPRIAQSESRQLPDSASRGIVTPRLAESRSRYSKFFKFIIDLQNFKQLNQPFKGPI